MSLFRQKYDRNHNKSRVKRDMGAFTSVENKSRFLSEGRKAKVTHS